jgi:hypothetical protein
VFLDAMAERFPGARFWKVRPISYSRKKDVAIKLRESTVEQLELAIQLQEVASAADSDNSGCNKLADASGAYTTAHFDLASLNGVNTVSLAPKWALKNIERI